MATSQRPPARKLSLLATDAPCSPSVAHPTRIDIKLTPTGNGSDVNRVLDNAATIVVESTKQRSRKAIDRFGVWCVLAVGAARKKEARDVRLLPGEELRFSIASASEGIFRVCMLLLRKLEIEARQTGSRSLGTSTAPSASRCATRAVRLRVPLKNKRVKNVQTLPNRGKRPRARVSCQIAGGAMTLKLRTPGKHTLRAALGRKVQLGIGGIGAPGTPQTLAVKVTRRK